MQGCSPEALVLNDEAYNIGGKEAWFYAYPSRELAEEILQRALSGNLPKGFTPSRADGAYRALVTWSFDNKVHVGDVLVDVQFNPLGFIVRVYSGVMVFDLRGDHIPMPRFLKETSSLRDGVSQADGFWLNYRD